MFRHFLRSRNLGVLLRVFDEAWMDIQTMLATQPVDRMVSLSHLAKRIMAAANSGERDPKRLKLIALRAIDA